jgi:hypothetical protein
MAQAGTTKVYGVNTVVAGKVNASGVDRTIFVGSTTPTGMATGDIWIQV